jgi:hypothetical protein
MEDGLYPTLAAAGAHIIQSGVLEEIGGTKSATVFCAIVSSVGLDPSPTAFAAVIPQTSSPFVAHWSPICSFANTWSPFRVIVGYGRPPTVLVSPLNVVRLFRMFCQVALCEELSPSTVLRLIAPCKRFLINPSDIVPLVSG